MIFEAAVTEPCTATAWNQVAIQITIVLGFVINRLITEWRDTKKERKAQAERKHHAEEIEEKVVTRAADLEKTVLDRAEKLAVKVDEGKRTSELAYSEANSINSKMVDMHNQFNDLLKRVNENRSLIDHQRGVQDERNREGE